MLEKKKFLRRKKINSCVTGQEFSASAVREAGQNGGPLQPLGTILTYDGYNIEGGCVFNWTPIMLRGAGPSGGCTSGRCENSSAAVSQKFASANSDSGARFGGLNHVTAPAGKYKKETAASRHHSGTIRGTLFNPLAPSQ